MGDTSGRRPAGLGGFQTVHAGVVPNSFLTGILIGGGTVYFSCFGERDHQKVIFGGKS